MDDRLSAIRKRAIQYWFVDGLAEISAGLFCFLLAGLFWIWPVIGNSPWSPFAILAALLLAAFGVRLVIQKIKERATYPLTGYAAPLKGTENKKARWFVAAFTLLLLAVNTLVSMQGDPAQVWFPLVSALVFAFIFGLAGYQAALGRLYLLAGVCLLAGIVLVLFRIGSIAGMAVMSGLVGVILVLFGMRARSLYRRESRPYPG